MYYLICENETSINSNQIYKSSYYNVNTYVRFPSTSRSNSLISWTTFWYSLVDCWVKRLASQNETGDIKPRSEDLEKIADEKTILNKIGHKAEYILYSKL